VVRTVAVGTSVNVALVVGVGVLVGVADTGVVGIMREFLSTMGRRAPWMIGVIVAVAVAVDVLEGVGVWVAVGVFVGVAVDVLVGVCVGVAVSVPVGVTVGVAVGRKAQRMSSV
jgi:hypothetical protein